jgi:hypothetical protein
MRPKLPSTWLSEVIYNSPETGLSKITQRLPHDVRIAAQQYLAARSALQGLEASPQVAVTQLERNGAAIP